MWEFVADAAEIAADSDCRHSPRLTRGATIGNRPRNRKSASATASKTDCRPRSGSDDNRILIATSASSAMKKKEEVRSLG